MIKWLTCKKKSATARRVYKAHMIRLQYFMDMDMMHLIAALLSDVQRTLDVRQERSTHFTQQQTVLEPLRNPKPGIKNSWRLFGNIFGTLWHLYTVVHTVRIGASPDKSTQAVKWDGMPVSSTSYLMYDLLGLLLRLCLSSGDGSTRHVLCMLHSAVRMLRTTARYCARYMQNMTTSTTVMIFASVVDADGCTSSSSKQQFLKACINPLLAFLPVTTSRCLTYLQAHYRL